jgi:hypothetical protein
MTCSFHDPGAYRECRESSAEWVKDKEKANKCEFFSPKKDSADSSNTKQSAKSALDDLFK